jgi:hypothetical protein
MRKPFLIPRNSKKQSENLWRIRLRSDRGFFYAGFEVRSSAEISA